MLRPALAYWVPVFALGFVLGTIRVLWLEPAVGLLAAVALEVPVMLLASASVARRLIRLVPITQERQALAIGGLAFMLLLVSEVALATLFGNGAEYWLAGLASPSGLLGFGGQAIFGVIPWLLLKARSSA